MIKQVNRLVLFLFLLGCSLLLVGMIALWAELQPIVRPAQDWQPVVLDSLPPEVLVNVSYGPIQNVARVTLEGAKAAYDRRQAVFVDVRSTLNCEQERIPGALCYQDERTAQLLDALDPDTWIITYCT